MCARWADMTHTPNPNSFARSERHRPYPKAAISPSAARSIPANLEYVFQDRISHVRWNSGPGITLWEMEMDDRTLRLALERHWDASDASDFEVEHEIYREDAVLHYPQSGERIRGRRNIQESRRVQPNKKRFTVRRIVGSGDLWVTEFVLTYDGAPSYTVSIMEFRDGLVASETQYFADPFDPAPSRAHLVERVG
jgi:SnoaL-like domain